LAASVFRLRMLSGMPAQQQQGGKEECTCCYHGMLAATTKQARLLCRPPAPTARPARPCTFDQPPQPSHPVNTLRTHQWACCMLAAAGRPPPGPCRWRFIRGQAAQNGGATFRGQMAQDGGATSGEMAVHRHRERAHARHATLLRLLPACLLVSHRLSMTGSPVRSCALSMPPTTRMMVSNTASRWRSWSSTAMNGAAQPLNNCSAGPQSGPSASKTGNTGST